MLLRYLTLLLFVTQNSMALSTKALSKEINEMLDNSHLLKSSYYSYLQSIESQKLTHAYSYPSFYLTLTPYTYNWDRDSSDGSSSGGVVHDLKRTSKVTNLLLKNIAHKLHAVDNSTTADYVTVSKYDSTYSDYSTGISYTLVDFGSQKASDAMAKINTSNSYNNFNKDKQDHILNGLQIYTQIVTSRNIILYAKYIKKQIEKDLQIHNQANQLDHTDHEKAKSTMSNIDAMIVNEEKKLSNAINQYEALFGHKPTDIPDYKLVSIPKNMLPQSKKSFIRSVAKNNLSIQAAKNNITSDKENYKKTKASHYPNISGSIDSSLSYDSGGDNMKSDSYSVTLSASYNTTFFTQGHEDKIAKLSILRSQENFLYTQRSILKNADQAWIDFNLDQKQLNLQIDGIRKAQEFIQHASKEYSEGKRSLLDVLDAKVDILKQAIALFDSYNAFTFQAFSMLEMKNELDAKDIKTENTDFKLIMDKIFLKDIEIRKNVVKNEDPAKVIRQIDSILKNLQ